MLSFETENPQATDFISRFTDKNYKVPKFIFGTNHDAIELAEQIDIDGFIDDLKPDKEFAGKPVIQSADIPQNAMVVIVALMRPVTLHLKLKKLGIEHIHSIAFLRFSSLKLTEPWFWKGFDEDFSQNRAFYESFDENLGDANSIETFSNLINFRLTGDLKFLLSFTDRQHHQYFEPFLELKDGECFIDVGGFDGQTALEFVKRCPNYQSIHLFEPENKNMITAKKACDGINEIHFHDVGLSNKKQKLGIVSGGSTSRVVPKGEGDYDIQLDTLDNLLLNQKVTFIKMDIEGAEQNALLGGQEIIKKQKPNLAICVYHQGNDIRAIYQNIKMINPQYKIYLRHYTEGIVETVMFFIN